MRILWQIFPRSFFRQVRLIPMILSDIDILVVDDDPDALDLLTHQLKGDAFNLHLCQSAQDALQTLSDQPQKFDVVLMDINMPGGMNGLECLTKIKAEDAFQNIPVILQTEVHNPGIITKALSAGAFYFLEKTSDSAVIQAVILSAMGNKVRFQEVEDHKRTLESGLQFVEEARFRIRTLEEMNTLTALLCTAFPHPDKVTLGIHELLTNAIEHGNLGITYDTKSQLILENKWKDEVERRLELEENKRKTVETVLKISDEEIELTIIDQGEGFRCENYLEIDPCRLFDAHGRGIAVAKSLSFDELEYIGKGNQVRAVVKL